MKRVFIGLSVVLLLSGCVTHQPISTVSQETTPSDQSQNEQSWGQPLQAENTLQDKLTSLIQRFLQTSEASESGVLLLDDIKNNSPNTITNQGEVNKDLVDVLRINTHFTVLDQKTINAAKRQLGLMNGVQRNSRSKAIALARYLKAQYVLYTTLRKSNQSQDPSIAMQLLLVSTGEIVWSASSDDQLSSSSDDIVNYY